MTPHGIFGDHAVAGALFDAPPDVVFFVKDTPGRDVVMNLTLADRCAEATVGSPGSRAFRGVLNAPGDKATGFAELAGAQPGAVAGRSRREFPAEILRELD